MFFRKLLFLLFLPIISCAAASFEVAQVIPGEGEVCVVIALNNQNQALGLDDVGYFFWSEETGQVRLCSDQAMQPLLNGKGEVLLAGSEFATGLQIWDTERGFQDLSLPKGVKNAMPVGFNDAGQLSVIIGETWDKAHQYCYENGEWKKLSQPCLLTRKMTNDGKLLFTKYNPSTGKYGPAFYEHKSGQTQSWFFNESSLALGCDETGLIVGGSEDFQRGWFLNSQNGEQWTFTNYVPKKINAHMETIGVLSQSEDEALGPSSSYYANLESGEMVHASKLVDDDSVVLLLVTDINERGWISGVASVKAEIQGVILKPKK